MKRTASIVFALLIVAALASSCRSQKNCPGMGVEKTPVEQPHADKT
jgi:hypothetical protein